MLYAIIAVVSYGIWWILSRALLHSMDEENWWEDHDWEAPPVDGQLVPVLGEMILFVAFTLLISPITTPVIHFLFKGLNVFTDLLINTPKYVARQVRREKVTEVAAG